MVAIASAARPGFTRTTMKVLLTVLLNDLLRSPFEVLEAAFLTRDNSKIYELDNMEKAR